MSERKTSPLREARREPRGGSRAASLVLIAQGRPQFLVYIVRVDERDSAGGDLLDPSRELIGPCRFPCGVYGIAEAFIQFVSKLLPLIRR